MLSGAGHDLLVKAVRLGQDRYILTVTPIDDHTPGAKQLITLTATTHLRKRRSATPDFTAATCRLLPEDRFSDLGRCRAPGLRGY